MCHLIASCFPKYDFGDIGLVYLITNSVYYSISGTLDLMAYYIIELNGIIIVPECG